MSDVKFVEDVKGTERVESKEPVALVDCGKATEVTKGLPYLPAYEGGNWPFDRIVP